MLKICQRITPYNPDLTVFFFTEGGRSKNKMQWNNEPHSVFWSIIRTDILLIACIFLTTQLVRYLRVSSTKTLNEVYISNERKRNNSIKMSTLVIAASFLLYFWTKPLNAMALAM